MREAEGIFRSTFGTDRTASFVIPAGVQVYGGFIGSETNLNQRPLFILTSSNRTTLSGNIDFNGDNDSYHVIRLSSGNEHTRLDGFVVADGKATGSPDTNENVGGGIYTESNRSSNLTIANCQFQHNTATSGGAIHISNETGESTINLISCLFSDNKAVGLSTGGAMLIRGNVKYRLINCLFVSNTSQFIGGAIACFGSNSGVSEFVNCTFTGNAVTTPYFDDGSATIYLDPSSTTRLNNCLIWGNSTGITSNGQVTYAYSDSQDGLQPGIGNRSINPQFVDAANGNFQLQSTSPLINAGDPASTTATVGNTDLAGGIRISSGRVDIGAFEYQSALPTSTPIALAGVSVSPNPVCAGQAVTVSATVNNVSGPYTFTLTNGTTSLSGSATSAAFSQSITASGAGLQTYTLVVADGSGTSSATASVTVKPKPSPPTVELLPAAVVCNTEMAIYFPASGNLINFSVFDATGRQVRYTGDPIPSGGGVTVSEVGQYTLVATAVLTGCLSDPMPPVSLTINPAPEPIGSFAANGSISCSQSTVTLTAVSATPGLHYVFAGPGVVSQSGNSAVVNQAGIYSVTGTIGGGCSAIASTTVTGTDQSPAAPALTASATSTTNQPISVTANGCSGTLNWSLAGGSGTASGAVYTLTTPGVYTLTASCTVGTCTGSASVPLVLTIHPAALGPLTLLAPAYICSTGAITFRTSGGNGSLIEYFAIGITSWTTNPNQTVEAGLRGDPKVIVLKARQSGTEVSYTFDLPAACAPSAINFPPVVNTPIGTQTAVVGQGYRFDIPASAFSDPEGQLLTYSVSGLPTGLMFAGSRISGTPSATGGTTLTVTATDPGSLSVSTSFVLRVNPPPTTSPTELNITGVTTLSCTATTAGQRQIVFMPQYAGLTGQPITFRVLNELAATTSAGPYSLRLYTDNPSITLKAQQTGRPGEASFVYNWLAACGSGTPTNQPPRTTGLPSQTITAGAILPLHHPGGGLRRPQRRRADLFGERLTARINLHRNNH